MEPLSLVELVTESTGQGVMTRDDANKLLHQVKKYEQKREAFIHFCNTISQIRTKKDLVSFIEQQLHSLFYFSDCSICLIDDEKRHVTQFIAGEGLPLESPVSYNCLYNTRLPLPNGVFESIINAEKPVFIKLETVAGKPGITKFIAEKFRNGVNEMVFVILRDGRRRSAVMIFESDRPENFDATVLRLIDQLSVQFAIAMTSIADNLNLLRSEEEKSLFLSLSEEIAGARDKSDLLNVINQSLKQLFYFTHSLVCMVDEMRATYGAYLVDPNSFINRHPEFEALIAGKYSVNDYPVKAVLENDQPMLFSLNELARANNLAKFLKMNYDTGIREVVMVPVKGNNRNIGFLVVFSDREYGFDANSLNILKTISSQFSTAVNNIVANEDIERREHEKSILLTFSNEISAVENLPDLGTAISNALKRLSLIKLYLIRIINDDKETTTTLVYDQSEEFVTDPEYQPLKKARFIIKDGLHDKLLASEAPMLFNVEKELSRKGVPGYVAYWKKLGIIDVLGSALRSGDTELGFIWAAPDQINMAMFQAICSQISSVLSNLISKDAVQKREQDKSLLLAFSNEMATVRSKQDIADAIKRTLIAHSLFDIYTCRIFNNDQLTATTYIYEAAEEFFQDPEFERMNERDFTIADSLSDKVRAADGPLLIDVEEELNHLSPLPEYLPLWKRLGVKTAMGCILRSGGTDFGIIWVEPKEITPYIFQAVCYQIASAISNIVANENIVREEHEKSILFTLSKEMSHIRGKGDMLNVINGRLKELFYFTHSVISKINDTGTHVRGYITDPKSPTSSHNDYNKVVFEWHPVAAGVIGQVMASADPLIFDLDELKNSGLMTGFLEMNYEKGIKEVLMISLRSKNKNIGYLILFSDKKNNFNKYSLGILNDVASLVSISLSNIIANEEIEVNEQEKSKLLTFSNEMTTVRTKADLALVISKAFKDLSLIKKYLIRILDSNGIRTGVIVDLTEPWTKDPEFLTLSTQKVIGRDPLSERLLTADGPITVNIDEILEDKNAPYYVPFWKKIGIRSMLGAVLRSGDEVFGLLWAEPDQVNINMFNAICSQISIALSNIYANERIASQLEEIRQYKLKLEEENSYLQEQIQTNYNYSEIIGTGPAMQTVYSAISQVAPQNTTVLILGETGTGKELIARAIHNASPRKDKIMVKVNCAALPPNLIESELFGHEKGSFTGATERRIGKFELADKGTLFLDEVGEMPLDLQVKLLRALQEREIERVGGQKTIKVDVRIIAATNRDLKKEVQEGKFRSDLYYRLMVFDIHMPALRDRTEDIPTLAAHFVARFSRNTGKKITSISNRAKEDLLNYSWPGNIRELEHLIERTILMTPGTTLKEVHLPVTKGQGAKQPADENVVKTLDENEREHILKVLKKVNGKIAGYGGAAELLGVPPSTLNSKIVKLGITKDHIFQKNSSSA